jgi:hypothetical protein
MLLLKKDYIQVFQSVLHNVFCFLVTHQTLDVQKILEVQKQVMITCYKLWAVLKMLLADVATYSYMQPHLLISYQNDTLLYSVLSCNNS